VRNLLSGPLAVFSECHAASSRESFANLRTYLNALEPEFTPDAMIQSQGLNHERIDIVIAAEKGYAPAIENLIRTQGLSTEYQGEIAYQISRNCSHHRYTLDDLLKVYTYYLYQIPLRQEDGVLSKNEKFHAGNSSHIFRELYAECPDFKEALIAYMESRTGWTHDHLILTGLDYRSAPRVFKAMDLRDQGSVFSSDIGA
jgi:hypothetical protein